MSIEAMKLALEALETALSDDQPYIVKSEEAITALKAALAEDRSADVGKTSGHHPLRKPLTYQQIHELDWPDGVTFGDIMRFTRAVEAAHGIKEAI